MSKFEKIDLGVKEAYDELFMNNQERVENRLPKIYDVPLDQIDDFPDHPYKVRNDEDMQNLVESVKQFGVITPITLREKKDGRYEIVSGHRRKRACELAGFNTVKAEIKELTRDEATILMVDSNFQRSTILPSEKAFAYKMKYDAIKRKQGTRTDLTSATVLQKSSRELLAENSGDSHEQIRKYIRLTNLVPELLEFVDEGKIKMRPAVELSYLDEDNQRELVDIIDDTGITPSHDQAIRMRKLFEENRLTLDVVHIIMEELKPNQKEKITLMASDIKKYIPANINEKQTQEYVIKALDFYKRYQDRQREQER